MRHTSGMLITALLVCYMSTSKLQDKVGNLLVRRFPECSIKENYRPEWLLSSNLTRLELDFYIDEINTAFEIQGIQHIEYVPFFHGTYDNYLEQQKRDKEKIDLCFGNGVRLFLIYDYQDILNALERISPRRFVPDNWHQCALEALENLNNTDYETQVPEPAIKIRKRNKAITRPIPKKKYPSFKFNNDFEYGEYLYPIVAEERIEELNKYQSKLNNFYKRKRFDASIELPVFNFTYFYIFEQEIIVNEMETQRQRQLSLQR